MAELLPAKPADLYLGVVDLFGVLIPGVALVAIIGPDADVLFSGGVISRPTGTIMTSAVYLVAGWILGQVLRAAGELLDLSLYDKWYVPAFKRKPLMPPPRGVTKMGQEMERWSPFDKVFHALNMVRPSYRREHSGTDPLLAAAQSLALDEVAPLWAHATPAASQKDVPLGLFGWVQVEVARSDPAAAASADRLTADSKFFRSFFFVAIAAILFSDPNLALIMGVIGFSVVSLVSYCRFRWKATATLYRSYVQMRLRLA